MALIGYFLGSIPFSYLVAKAYQKNLYQIGSGNIGAANVWRATGKIGAPLMAVIGDLGKGALAIFLATKFPCQRCGLEVSQMAAAFFVVLGHNWPIFLKFKGGKGLASLAGVILFLNWSVLPLVLVTFGFFIFLTELIMKKGIKLVGPFKENIKSLFSMFISQVLGRVIGLVAAIILVYLLYPEVFKIAFPAVILSGIRHIKRTKDFLKG
jgi:glycerol-3-phosphate acyltransferase PlsY